MMVKENNCIWCTIKNLVDVELLLKPTFLLVGASGFLSLLGFFVPLFFLPSMAESIGIEKSNANFLISIYGK